MSKPPGRGSFRIDIDHPAYRVAQQSAHLRGAVVAAIAELRMGKPRAALAVLEAIEEVPFRGR